MSVIPSSSGKLIVIEGTDGSGKKTQTARLLTRLAQDGLTAESIDFPRYETPSGYFVEKYLHGGYGTPKDVGPYAGSLFYALDRYEHSFEMRKKLASGITMVCDRYVSANMGHQAGKIADEHEREVFLEWVSDLEYSKLSLPKPDLTILLYVSPETNRRLMETRPDKAYLKGKRKDVHEEDFEHIKAASEAFLRVARKYGWTVIDCAPKSADSLEGDILSIDDIHKLVWSEVQKLVQGHVDAGHSDAKVDSASVQDEVVLS